MTPARLRQRQRILKARKVGEQIAEIEHLAASDAAAQAGALAKRLAEEIARCGSGTGATTGQMLAARAALADRLVRAVDSVTARQNALNATEHLAAQRSLAARQSRRSAEMLTERAEAAAATHSERRFATPSRKREARR